MVSIRRLLSDLIGLLFPNLCNGCGRALVTGEQQICTSCLHDLPYTGFEKYDGNIVERLFWGRLPLDGAMAMLYFKKGSRVQQMIHHLKYKDQPATGRVLGRLLGHRLLSAPLYQTIQLIIPVPLHKNKKNIRGYNQSEHIAMGIAEVLHIPVDTTHLIRQHHTTTQTHKSRYQRFENMTSVFKLVDPASLKDKHILLVDDVITTGSTLEACGNLLSAHQVKKLSIAAIAYAE